MIRCRKKPKGPTARRRAVKRRKTKTAETAEMKRAAARDWMCRFPMCGCQSGAKWPIVKIKPEVSHQQHRGMGGNPTGERTQSRNLLLLCNWRHKLSKFSVDRKGIRWEALTEQGADGPIRWLISLNGLLPNSLAVLVHSSDEWFPLAVETAPHEYEPFTPAQSATLAWLAEMTV